MTSREAHNVAAQVMREAASKVRVTVGQTNGRCCVHVNDLDPRDPSRSSTTIYSEAEWAIHPLNRSNRPTKAAKARREAQDAAESLPEPEATMEHVFRGALGLLDSPGCSVMGDK